MLSKRDFFGKEFYAVCQQEYDIGRNYLKTCGKPKDAIDKWFIEFHKDTVKIFGKLLKEKNHVHS
jgi:hypothetical protein